MSESATPADAGKLLLRLAIAVLILLHGLSKLHNGLGPVVDALARQGLPGGVAFLVYVGEVLAPLLLIAGVWTQPAALLVVINMLVAIVLVHTGQILTLDKSGGWALELQGMYLFGALAVTLLGAGRLSIGGLRGRWN